MYGLVAAHGPHTGMPIQKPWRVACSPNSSLPTLLCKRCDGSHDRTRREGQNTLLTQGYTPEIAKIVNHSIFQDIMMHNKSNVSKVDGEHSDRSVLVSYSGRSILSIGIDEMEEQVAVLALGD